MLIKHIKVGFTGQGVKFVRIRKMTAGKSFNSMVPLYNTEERGRPKATERKTSLEQFQLVTIVTIVAFSFF